MSRYIVTLGVEEFIPEGANVTDVIYDRENETIMVEYEAEEGKQERAA